MNTLKRLAVLTFAWAFFVSAVVNTSAYAYWFATGSKSMVGLEAFPPMILDALFWALWWILKDWKPKTK